jgi:hypothetical protein
MSTSRRARRSQAGQRQSSDSWKFPLYLPEKWIINNAGVAPAQSFLTGVFLGNCCFKQEGQTKDSVASRAPVSIQASVNRREAFVILSGLLGFAGNDYSTDFTYKTQVAWFRCGRSKD